MNRLWLVGFVFFMLVGTVLGAAPTTPSTVTPANGSEMYNVPLTLTCSGSTDGDGDPINYTFWGGGKYGTRSNNSTWTVTDAGGQNFIIGTNATTHHSITNVGGAAADDGSMYFNVTFPQDTFYFNHWLEDTGGGLLLRLYVDIDGATKYDSGITPAQFNWTRKMIDVSAYNDGGQHLLRFRMTDGGGGGCDWRWNFWWEDQRELQNSTSSTFSWDVGAIDENFWGCQACDDNGDCSAWTDNQTLYVFELADCTGQSSPLGHILNYTGYDEETEDRVSELTFDGSFTLGSSQDSKIFSFEKSGATTYQFCLYPVNVSTNISFGLIDYTSTNTSYSYPRQYYYQDVEVDPFSRSDVPLYLLTDAYADAVTFTASRSGVGVGDILIHVQRYNPGTGIYRSVAMGNTNPSGQYVIYLRLTDAFYYVLGYEDGILVYDSSQPEQIPTGAYSMYLSGGAGAYPTWPEEWYKFGTISYSLTWNATATNKFRLIADDASGATTSMCLKVDKYKDGDVTDVCYKCDTSSSVTITCGVSDFDAGYVAKFIVYKNSMWQTVAEIYQSFTIGLEDLIGLDGPVYAFLLIGILAFVGLYNPPVAIILALVGAIVSFSFGFINVGWGAIVSLVIVGIILIVKSRT